MATIDIGAITVPTADFVDVQAALTAYYATPAIPAPTNAQLLEAMRQEVITKIKAVTKAYRASQVAVVDPVAT